MTFLRIVIPLYLFDLCMIFSENRYPLFRIMHWLGPVTNLQAGAAALAHTGAAADSQGGFP
jgi:hypothetical protein